MVRAASCLVAGVLALPVMWLGVAHFTSVEAAAIDVEQPPSGNVKADAKDPKSVNLDGLRDAIATAAKRGENVDEIQKALDAFARTSPKAGSGTVSPQLQALRDAVDAAARKGENVEAITKELVAIEMAVAGKNLARPRPEPVRPEINPNPNPGQPFPFPQPFPVPLQPVAPGGVDVEMFNKAMDLQRKAMELMMKNPRDPEVIKEAQKLRTEAAELLLKAARGGNGGAGLPVPVAPLFPNPDLGFGRAQDRARFGIRMDRVPVIAVEQLGLDPNTGIAVALVMPGSAAEKAGLKVHDIILQFAGKAVTDNTEDFIRLVNEVKAGDKIDIVVLRKGKKVELKGVELPEMKPARPQPGAFDFPNVFPDAPAKPPRPVVPPLPNKDGAGLVPVPLPLLP